MKLYLQFFFHKKIITMTSSNHNSLTCNSFSDVEFEYILKLAQKRIDTIIKMQETSHLLNEKHELTLKLLKYHKKESDIMSPYVSCTENKTPVEYWKKLCSKCDASLLKSITRTVTSVCICSTCDKCNTDNDQNKQSE